MLNASQLLTFYPDLLDPRLESAIAMVHSRFSTNTFPSWARAHPYRYISHNGEINTLRGNVNWIHARQSKFRSSLFGDDLTKVLPAIDPDGSDSAILDNVLELLHLSGRSLAARDDDDGPRAVAAATRRCRPSAAPSTSTTRASWSPGTARRRSRSPTACASARRSTATASVPARYYVTRDGRVVMASEAGVLDIPAAEVLAQGPAPARPHVPRRHGARAGSSPTTS